MANWRAALRASEKLQLMMTGYADISWNLGIFEKEKLKLRVCNTSERLK